MASTNTSPIGLTSPVITVTTDGIEEMPTSGLAGGDNSLYPSGVPEPVGTTTATVPTNTPVASSDPSSGVGSDGEVIIWEARYSKLNFVGRILWRIAATMALIPLAMYTYGADGNRFSLPTKIGFWIVVFLWAQLFVRMIQAYFSHYYQLTNRRLFVTTGIFRRRREMMELLHVKDVLNQQHSILDRTLQLGTVMITPDAKELPIFYIVGVSQPTEVMDLIWHHARAERDQRSVKVDSI